MWSSHSGVPLKALMAALSACQAARDLFPAKAAAAALGQLVGRSPLPPLFMRHVMQVRIGGHARHLTLPNRHPVWWLGMFCYDLMRCHLAWSQAVLKCWLSQPSAHSESHHARHINLRAHRRAWRGRS